MDRGGEYSLKWNSHKSTVMSAFTCLFENEKHADCTLAAEGKTVKAHKVMISACSPYLEKLLEDHSKDKSSHPIVIFNDLSFFELKALCEYMYKGEVNVPKENLDSFLKVAKCMQVRGLCDGGGGESIGGMDSKPSSSPARLVKGSPAHVPSSDKRKPMVSDSGNKQQQQGSASQQPPAKRKRQDGFDSDTSQEAISFVQATRGRGKQLKQAKVIATCPPRVVQEVKPEIVKQEEPEAVYEETVYQDLTFEEEIYQDPGSEPGTSADATIEFGNWNDGNSNDFNVQDSGSQDQETVITEIIRVAPRKRHACRDCGRTYKLPTSLFNHRKYECGKGATFVCVECPMMFKRPENLKRHINVKHNPQPIVYMCRICGHVTKSKGNLKIHMVNTHNAVESVVANVRVEKVIKQE